MTLFEILFKLRNKNARKGPWYILPIHKIYQKSIVSIKLRFESKDNFAFFTILHFTFYIFQVWHFRATPIWNGNLLAPRFGNYKNIGIIIIQL